MSADPAADSVQNNFTDAGSQLLSAIEDASCSVAAIERLIPFCTQDSLSEGLLTAVECNRLDAVKLIASASDPKNDESLALQNAAYYGFPDIVSALIPVSDPLVLGSQALRVAAQYGHLDAVRALIPVSDPTEGKSDALCLAAKCGHLEVVRALVPVSDLPADGGDALRLAAYNGCLDVVRYMASVINPVTNGSEALRWAAKGGQLDVVRFLLPLSDPKANNSEALRWAAERAHIDAVHELLPVSDPFAAFRVLVQSIERDRADPAEYGLAIRATNTLAPCLDDSVLESIGRSVPEETLEQMPLLNACLRRARLRVTTSPAPVPRRRPSL